MNKIFHVCIILQLCIGLFAEQLFSGRKIRQRGVVVFSNTDHKKVLDVAAPVYKVVQEPVFVRCFTYEERAALRCRKKVATKLETNYLKAQDYYDRLSAIPSRRAPGKTLAEYLGVRPPLPLDIDLLAVLHEPPLPHAIRIEVKPYELIRVESMPEDTMCVICQEDQFVNNEDSGLSAAKPICGHIFHRKCMLAYLKSTRSQDSVKNNCPLCRVPLQDIMVFD